MFRIILVILLLILIVFILRCCVCNTMPYGREVDDEQQMGYLRQYREQCKEHHKDK